MEREGLQHSQRSEHRVDSSALPQLKQGDRNKGAWLGIRGGDHDDGGVLIAEVMKGMAAEKGGIKKGDIIREFGGDAVQTMMELRARIMRRRIGDKVKVGFSSIGDRQYDGTVTEVAFAAIGLQTTFPVSIKLSDIDDQVRPGMAADVFFTFVYQEGEDKMMVPPFAVGEDQEGRFVYVVTETDEQNIGVIERKPVSIGELTNDGLKITNGLDEGSLVVTAGVSKISEGMKVIILQ